MIHIHHRQNAPVRLEPYVIAGLFFRSSVLFLSIAFVCLSNQPSSPALLLDEADSSAFFPANNEPRKFLVFISPSGLSSAPRLTLLVSLCTLIHGRNERRR